MIKTILVRLLSRAGMSEGMIGVRRQDIHKNKEFNCG